MALTTLDKIPALVIIDLQKGLAGLPAAHPFGDIVERSRRLAEAFRSRGLPVVLVNVAGGSLGRTDAQRQGPAGTAVKRPADWADLLPELGTHGDDIKITKRSWGAFHNTPLAGELASRQATQIV